MNLQKRIPRNAQFQVANDETSPGSRHSPFVHWTECTRWTMAPRSLHVPLLIGIEWWHLHLDWPTCSIYWCLHNSKEIIYQVHLLNWWGTLRTHLHQHHVMCRRCRMRTTYDEQEWVRNLFENKKCIALSFDYSALVVVTFACFSSNISSTLPIFSSLVWWVARSVDVTGFDSSAVNLTDKKVHLKAFKN